MNREQLERLNDAAGGRWAISWQAIAISLPIGFLYSLATLIQPDSEMLEKQKAVLLSLLTCLVLVSWTVLLDRLIFVNRIHKRMSIPSIMFGGVSSGVLYSLMLTLSISLMGLADPIGTWARLFVSVMVLTVWGISISLLLDARERFNSEFNDVIEQAAQVQIAAGQANELIAKFHQALDAEISEEISRASIDFEHDLNSIARENSEPNWADASNRLRVIASDIVRPLSKRLWERGEENVPSIRLTQILKNIVKYQRFRPIPVLFVYALTTGIGQFIAFEPSLSIPLFALEASFIVLMMICANELMGKWARFHIQIFVATVVIFQFFNIFTADIRAEYGGSPVTLGSTITDTVASVLLLLISSGIGSIQYTRESIINTFRTDLDEKQVILRIENRHISDLAISASSFLHGQFQTRLLSCAAAIDQAAESGDLKSLNSALHEARLVMDSNFSTTAERGLVSVGEEIRSKCDLWMGLCEIEVEAPISLLELSGGISEDIGAIVEEAISNAIRHGKAGKIIIELTESMSNFVTVNILDDGLGPAGGTTNVGFNIYSRISRGNFCLTEGDGGIGSKLSAVIPIR